MSAAAVASTLAGPAAPASTATAPDRCPRCGGGFACGAGGPGPCDCAKLTLDAALLARLRERYAGCLCLACLRELARAGTAGGAAAPCAVACPAAAGAA